MSFQIFIYCFGLKKKSSVDFDPSPAEHKIQGENLQVDICTPKPTCVRAHKLAHPAQACQIPESTNPHFHTLPKREAPGVGVGVLVGWVEPGHSGTLTRVCWGGFCPRVAQPTRRTLWQGPQRDEQSPPSQPAFLC